MSFCLATVGFSTRALVSACAARGLRPYSIDAFADHDCRQHAAACKIVAWNKSRAEVSAIVSSLKGWEQGRNQPPLHVLFAGGIENWPALVQEIEEHLSVLGPNSAQMKALRNPLFWKKGAELGGVAFPASHWGGKAGELPPGEWLCKSLLGSGGTHVRRVAASLPAKQTPERVDRESHCELESHSRHGEYLQQLVAGRVLGAHFVCDPKPRLLGITESFQACDWAGPSEFAYRGSWGPVDFVELGVAQPKVLVEQLLRTADALQAASDLRGWLQMDVVLDEQDRLWLLEVNPRWSAGMEVLVDSGIEDPVAAHLAAFGLVLPNGALPDVECRPKRRRSAKAVVYADAPVVLTASRLSAWQQQDGLADVPAKEALGETILAGHPLATVKACLDRCEHQQSSERSSFESDRQRLLAMLYRLSQGLHVDP